MHVLPFEASIPEEDQDPEIAERINLAAVLAWAVKGYQRYRKAGGLEAPVKVREAVAEYRDDMDKLSGFVEERLELDPASSEPVSALHEAYRDWCCSNQIYKPLAKNAFSDVLVARPGLSRDRRGKDRVRVIIGVRLREDVEDRHG